MVDITDLVFRTDGESEEWGAGKGANLTPREVDSNFWVLLAAIMDMQSNPPAPLEIESITVSENKMTVLMSDGVTSFGPYTLPVASFNWRDTWKPNTAYKFCDFFTAPEGLYLVLQDHTSDATFNPDAGNMQGPFVKLIFPNLYDLGFFMPGVVGNAIAPNGAMFAYLAPRDFYFPAGLPLCRASLWVAPLDALTFDVCKNGEAIASVSFNAGETVGAISAIANDVQFSAGDRLRIIRPAVLDDDAADLNLTFSAVKGLAPEASSESESV